MSRSRGDVSQGLGMSHKATTPAEIVLLARDRTEATKTGAGRMAAHRQAAEVRRGRTDVLSSLHRASLRTELLHIATDVVVVHLEMAARLGTDHHVERLRRSWTTGAPKWERKVPKRGRKGSEDRRRRGIASKA